jgi:uncharacterized protein
MSTIIVFGVTGFAGGHIANELLARGHTVVGVARDVSRLAGRPGFEARAGSVHDAAFVREVVKGADDIIVSVPSKPADEPELRDVLPSLLDAAAAVGARVGIVGGAGSLATTEGGHLVYDDPEWNPDYLEIALAHARALAYLRETETPVDWYYVSPPWNFGSWAPGTRRGTFRIGADTLLRDADGESHISGEDMAIAFADEIEKPRHHKTRFTVGY